MACRATAFKKRTFDLLQKTLIERARQSGLLRGNSWAIVDSTGLETSHASRYFARVKQAGFQPSWPKLTVVCHSQSHFFITADVCLGPSNDSPQFEKVVRPACKLVGFDHVLADKGYDSEKHHKLCHEELRIKPIIGIRKGRIRNVVKSYYRGQLDQNFPKEIYGQRWQIESAFSRTKRRLGPALCSRKWQTQIRECHLRVLTHNIMILGAHS